MELVCFSDSNYTGDPESRRSVSGIILYVHGIPINWKSKAQCSVALTSSEIKVKHPITVHVDNLDAIFMTNDITTTGCTKHMDICYKFVTKNIEDEINKITFVKSADYDCDIMTKNLKTEQHSKDASKIISA